MNFSNFHFALGNGEFASAKLVLNHVMRTMHRDDDAVVTSCTSGVSTPSKLKSADTIDKLNLKFPRINSPQSEIRILSAVPNIPCQHLTENLDLKPKVNDSVCINFRVQFTVSVTAEIFTISLALRNAFGDGLADQ